MFSGGWVSPGCSGPALSVARLGSATARPAGTGCWPWTSVSATPADPSGAAWAPAAQGPAAGGTKPEPAGGTHTRTNAQKHTRKRTANTLT